MACAPRIRFVLLALLALTFPSAALAQSSQEEAGVSEPPVEVTNAYCPVMPDEAVDPNFFVDHLGTRVYLCCKRCKSKFEADPEAYVANLAFFQPDATQGSTPAESQTVVETTNAYCPVMPEEPIDSSFFSDYLGKRVYFCCKRCKSKFDEDPEPYLANLASFQPDAIPVTPPPATEPAAEAEAPPADDQASSAEDQHEHAEESSEFDWLEYLGRFHPVVVHFPIGLLIIAAFFELISLVAPRTNARTVVRATLATGALGALVAAPLGLANAIGVDFTGTLGWVFWWHRALGIAVAVLAIVAWIAVERRQRAASPSRIGAATWLILCTALLVGLVGHFGGSLIYGWKHLWPPM
jgi:YHS domain-containing protein/uncharacterized membrane protein